MNQTTQPVYQTLTYASMIKRLVFGTLLINLLVFVMAGLSIYQSRLQFQERAEITTQNLARVLEENIDGAIDKIDMSLLSVQDEVRRQLASGGIDAKALNAFIAHQQDHQPEILSLRATDAEGIVRYGRGVPASGGPKNSDREYFIRARDESPPGLIVTKPVFTRIDKKWAIVLARRLSQPDGYFAGVVYANVALEHLSKTFSEIDVGPHGAVALRDGGLGLITRYPAPKNLEQAIGTQPSSDMQQRVQSGLSSATYRAIPSAHLDDIERTFTYRKLSGKPFYIVVGLAPDDYLAVWRQENAKAAALMLLFFLTTALSSWLLYRSWKSQITATEALAAQEDKFRTVADHTYDWEYWQGPNRETLYMSPSCERVTGYSPAEFVADPDLLNRIVLPIDRNIMDAHLHNDSYHDESRVDFRIARRDGEIRWISHGCRAVYGANGQFLGRRVSNRDETERKQAEAAVRHLNAELEQRVVQRTAQLEAANKELEEFSYSMSHDMRTPLRALDGFSKIFLEEYGASLDEEGKRLLKILRDNAQRMGRLVDDLLRYLSLGRRRMESCSFDIAKLASEIFTELQAAAPAHHLRLVIGTLPPAWGDRDMVREVLHNLLSNAIKYSPVNGEELIEVGGTAEKDENVYWVTDHGIGFDMRYADKLFRVFERVHPTGQYEGSGIGLAIVKRIITRHGGRVWAEGKVNEGAMVYFTLPVHNERSANEFAPTDILFDEYAPRQN